MPFPLTAEDKANGSERQILEGWLPHLKLELPPLAQVFPSKLRERRWEKAFGSV